MRGRACPRGRARGRRASRGRHRDGRPGRPPARGVGEGARRRRAGQGGTRTFGRVARARAREPGGPPAGRPPPVVERPEREGRPGGGRAARAADAGETIATRVARTSSQPTLRVSLRRIFASERANRARARRRGNCTPAPPSPESRMRRSSSPQNASFRVRRGRDFERRGRTSDRFGRIDPAWSRHLRNKRMKHAVIRQYFYETQWESQSIRSPREAASFSPSPPAPPPRVTPPPSPRGTASPRRPRAEG